MEGFRARQAFPPAPPAGSKKYEHMDGAPAAAASRVTGLAAMVAARNATRCATAVTRAAAEALGPFSAAQRRCFYRRGAREPTSCAGLCRREYVSRPATSNPAFVAISLNVASSKCVR